MIIKSKLQLGSWFIFSLILVLCGLSISFMNRLTGDAKTILKANYESVEYAKNMLQVLDNPFAKINKEELAIFEKNLMAQEHNITEVGEETATRQLRGAFTDLERVTNKVDYLAVSKEVNRLLYKIIDINSAAMIRKSNLATTRSSDATLYLSVIATLCFLAAFTFAVNFPGYIANPISELTVAIEQIAQKNYDQRLFYTSNDEFGHLAASFNTMAEKLNEYEHSNLAKVIFEKSRTEALINTLSDGVLGLDENGYIIFVNILAANLIGMFDSELVGKYAPDVALLNDLVRNLLQADGQKQLSIFFQGKENIFFKETHEVVSQNQRIGRVIILKNITQFHELNSAKTNFIATISHELKTPISAIMISIKLMNDERVGVLNEEQKQLVSNLSDDVQRLLKMTRELTDMAQVETGNIRLKASLINPESIIEMALKAIEFSARQRCVRVSVASTLSRGERVMADEEKTVWVLTNLISNAIRYSKENGEVIVAIESEEKEVKISVQDFGKGIEKKYCGKLFDRYFQVPSDHFAREGTGLGLSISKDIIQAQGGSIGVKSVLNEGSTFFFTLKKE